MLILLYSLIVSLLFVSCLPHPDSPYWHSWSCCSLGAGPSPGSLNPPGFMLNWILHLSLLPTVLLGFFLILYVSSPSCLSFESLLLALSLLEVLSPPCLAAKDPLLADPLLLHLAASLWDCLSPCGSWGCLVLWPCCLWDCLVPCAVSVSARFCGRSAPCGLASPAPSCPGEAAVGLAMAWGLGLFGACALQQWLRWNQTVLPLTFNAVEVARVTLEGPSCHGWSHFMWNTLTYTNLPGHIVCRVSGISAPLFTVAPLISVGI